MQNAVSTNPHVGGARKARVPTVARHGLPNLTTKPTQVGPPIHSPECTEEHLDRGYGPVHTPAPTSSRSGGFGKAGIPGIKQAIAVLGDTGAGHSKGEHQVRFPRPRLASVVDAYETVRQADPFEREPGSV